MTHRDEFYVTAHIINTTDGRAVCTCSGSVTVDYLGGQQVEVCAAFDDSRTVSRRSEVWGMKDIDVEIQLAVWAALLEGSSPLLDLGRVEYTDVTDAA